MTDVSEVCRIVGGLTEVDVERWVSCNWVRPLREGGRFRFSEIDVARVRLIHELRDDLSIDEDTLPVVLNLLDQVYGLRANLRLLAGAVAAQPEPVRRSIADAVADRRRGPG